MENKELQLAWDFVNHTKRNIFLTGKAGTGKTTFLHRLKNESMKRLAVVAPTGVAAINARGVTIHSFFQMPFGPILPEEANQSIQRDFKRKFSKKKIDIIKSLDLLIIDEISMVRADLLDGIDQVLRKYKHKNKVFGGVQVLMIGDLQQLAPVVKNDEWQLLKKYYETPYFFSSKAFRSAQAVSIELKNIYRQEDEKFIKILNEIRENKLSKSSAEQLNKRYIPDFNPADDEDYILLTTHNYKADKINREKLDAIPEKTYYFQAYTEGHFPENAYPNDERLALKKGAQVMFIKNDASFEKRYYNGKIGKITAIDDKNIWVQCPDDDFEIEVERATWENINYEINSETQAIEEKVKGSFSQIPLRLSWAITIHKSQGLTFDKAIIDAELSFAHGQTYVALSRCKTLEGLVLKSPIKPQSIINDQRVTGFTKEAAAQQPDAAALEVSKKMFFLDSVAEMLDFYPFLFPVNRLLDIQAKNSTSIKGTVADPLQDLKEKGIVPLLQVKNNFLSQLQNLSKDVTEPEKDVVIQERIEKAVAYFLKQTEEIIKSNFEAVQYDIDNKQIRKDFEKHFNQIHTLLQQKLYVLERITFPFKIENYLDIRAKSVLEQSPVKKQKVDYSKLVTHADLLDALKDLRTEFAMQENIPHFQVFTQETLYQLCEDLPVTQVQLKKINGIGKVRLQKYGDAITEVILAYCIANNITIKPDEKVVETKKENTKEVSLKMYQSGMKPEQIAAERNLTLNTIMGHLSNYLSSGEVNIIDLIPEDRFKQIKKIIEENTFEGLSELKKIAGDNFDWGELRLVLKYVTKPE